MLSYLNDPHRFSFLHTFSPFAHGSDLPLPDVLPDADVRDAFADVDFGSAADALWTPALTLWAFLGQVLGADKSCRQAVANVVLAFALTIEPTDLDTAGYCRVRAKLPAPVIRRLCLRLGHNLEQHAPAAWLWHGRHVKMVDGSTSKLPDTAKNRAAFPQPNSQKAGLGLPVIRWVVIIALATAAMQGFAYGPYQGKETGETALLRELLDEFDAGDVALMDRYYCSYFMAALLMAGQVGIVARMHQKRKYDFRRGRRLGPKDHIVDWHRPARPKWMSEELYALLPATIQMREIYCKVKRPGYRVRELVIVTTLWDATLYSAEAVCTLYEQRWQVELDIRNLKTTLGMDGLRCKSPAMVEREIWMHLLAYNLVRKVMAQAAVQADLSPRQLSFKAAKQAILAGWQQMTMLGGQEAIEAIGQAKSGGEPMVRPGAAQDYAKLANGMLGALESEQVGDRPGRCEPRAVKERGKPHKLLTEPREQARAKLLNPKKQARKKRRKQK